MVTIDDVEKLDATNWSHLDDQTKQEWLEIAEGLISNQFGGRVATVPELQGNQDHATKVLSAHLFELAEGGEAQSESSTGGSVNYNTVTGDVVQSLSETRYGRLFRSEFLADETGRGIVRTW